MSPPPTPSAAAPRQSQGDRPEESRQSREGQADPSVPKDPVTQADVDVTPLECVRGEAPRSKRKAGTGGEKALDGRNPGRHRRLGSLRGSDASTSSSRARSPEAARVRPLPMGARRIDAKNDRRAGIPKGTPIDSRRRPWRVKPMDAPVPKGAGRDGGGRRDGGTQTSDATRRGAGRPAGHGSAIPGCVEGRESPGEEASSDVPVFGPAGRCGGAVMDL